MRIAVAVLSLVLLLPLAAVTGTAASPADSKVVAPALKAGTFDPPRSAPDFSLQGSDGRELKMSGHRGKVVLLAFGYSSCPAVCPTTLATFAAARRQLGAASGNVQVIYVTVDPERDDSAHLKKYLAAFDGTFIGGTGTPDQLAAVRKAYGISAEKMVSGDSYAYSHSSFTYLIDRAGRIRALMPYGHNPQDYVHDLTILLEE
jgi:protein SCO1